MKQKKERDGGGGPRASVLAPPPDFIAERLVMWDRLKAEQDAMLAAKAGFNILPKMRIEQKKIKI